MHHEYKQPSFYHFNEDSILLVKEALKLEEGIESVLDLCAGCGVIGVEYAISNSKIKRLSFVELQKQFIKYIEL